MTYNFNYDPEENKRAAAALALFVFCASIAGIVFFGLVALVTG